MPNYFSARELMGLREYMATMSPNAYGGLKEGRTNAHDELK
jgi:hypothetical protein